MQGRKETPPNLWILTFCLRLQFNTVLSRAIACRQHLLDSVSENTKDVNSDPSWGKASCDGTGATATAVQIQPCFLDDNTRPQWADQEEAEHKACMSWCKLLLVTSVTKRQWNANIRQFCHPVYPAVALVDLFQVPREFCTRYSFGQLIQLLMQRKWNER